jgi:hypothetical protein
LALNAGTNAAYIRLKRIFRRTKGSLIMRNVFFPGLLALTLPVLSASVFAGNVAVCEEIKDDPAYKGLYGLCNAYWNETDEAARADILAAFQEKAGTDTGGPGMPGLEPDPDPDPEPDPAACPCWDETHMATASANGTPVGCVTEGGIFGTESALYGTASNPENAYVFYVEYAFCFRTDPLGGEFKLFEFNEAGVEAEVACRLGVQALIEMDFGGIVCTVSQ